MGKEKLDICFVGAGSIGTALGNVLARKGKHNIRLLSIEADVVDSINNKRVNSKYFPNIKLGKSLKATADDSILSKSDVIFLAIPSVVTVDFIEKNRELLNRKAPVVNLAKGFSRENRVIAESLSMIIDNDICAMKGPTFAREVINKVPTAFTIGAKNEDLFPLLDEIFRDTNIHLDFCTDVKGVELLSILKNIYAIIMGIVDANFNSANLRSLVLTKAFKEMEHILLQFGGQKETMLKYCGYGDFTLTALNDLSRNRTLGLLIGKGFFTEDISSKVVLEGQIAVNVFVEEISRINSLSDYHLINELYKVFHEKNYDIGKFTNNIVNC